MKKKLQNCLCASLLFGALATGAYAADYDIYKAPESTPMIEYHILHEGIEIETEDGTAFSRQIGENERFALFDATKRWQDMLHLESQKKLPVVSVQGSDDLNASASSPFYVYETTDGTPVKVTNLALSLLGINVEEDDDYADNSQGNIEIGIGLINGHEGWARYIEPYPIFNEMLPDLYSTVVHEIFHAVGLMSSREEYGNSYYFSSSPDIPISIMDIYLRATDGTTIVLAQPGMEVKTNDSSAGEFDLVNGSPYFTGLNTMMTLSGITIEDLENAGLNPEADDFEQDATDKIESFIITAGGLKNYSNQYSNDDEKTRIVYGLPINGLEYIGQKQDGEEVWEPELSHIELRNSFMSHQNYQNWGILMEAELAFLKDIGFENVEVREFFGKSYYLNGEIDDNGESVAVEWKGYNDSGIGYGYWDIDNQKYTNAPSKIINGIGLHLYGDNLNITQKASISSEGLATIGVRIDGVENTYTLANRIDTVGRNSIGLATMWGKNHTINLQEGSVINASGENGMALVFDFGKNIIGGYDQDRGSYSSSNGINDIEVQDDIYGALVSDVNIAGEITGSKAAIYISENAHVENINIMNGSKINGDIISNWNSTISGYKMTVQVDDDDLKYTNINFGSDGDGFADRDYKGSYTGIINGSNKYLNTLKLNIRGGELTYNDGIAIVNSVDITAGTTLSGSASYKVDEKFKIYSGANYNPTGNALIEAKEIVNNGFINVKENFVLASPLRSGLDGDINLYGTMFVMDDAYLSSNASNNLVFYNGSSLNLINNKTTNVVLGTMVLEGNANLYVDADLTTKEIDRLAFEDKDWLDAGNNTLNIAGINLMNSKDVAKEKRYDFLFVDKSLNNQELLGKVKVTDNQVIATPVYKYNFSYNEANERGNITLARMNTGSYRDYNPAVLSSSVAAQVGGYLNQLNTFNEAFSSMDAMMSMPSSERKAMEFGNKYAVASTNIQTFSPNQSPEEQKGVWFKPFTTFEKVDLNNGPKVNNVAYGSFVGADSERYELKNGWNAIYTGYTGYIGSHQKFNGVSVYQNGGVLGLTGLFYKNNFFTGLTANVGASVAEANNMYGREDMTMLSSGIASKTGYNFEFFNERFIVQPNLLLSYSFVNTFDYTNSAGLKVNSDPLHAIQIAPGLKFIGNLPNSWQPYASVQMLWNVMDISKVSVAGVNLPELSVDPYVQYGVGVQKNVGKKFTGYGQVMLRNGGRTGISLSAGARWALGSEF